MDHIKLTYYSLGVTLVKILNTNQVRILKSRDIFRTQGVKKIKFFFFQRNIL